MIDLIKISAGSLKAHLAFLSSTPLQGRRAGLLGLDVAAEYIASQFRRAGLRPVGDDGYFQTTPRVRLSPNPDGYRCALESGGKTIEIAPSQFALSAGLAVSGNAIRETHVEGLSIVKVPIAGPVPEGIGDAAGVGEFCDSVLFSSPRKSKRRPCAANGDPMGA